MKKKMAVASGLLLTAILLTGCGGDKEDQLVGKWNATKVKVEDTEVSMDAFLEQLGDPRMKMSLEFFEDGNAECDIMGTEAEGVWEANEDGTFTLTDESGDSEITIEDGELLMEYAEIQFVFEKAE